MKVGVGVRHNRPSGKMTLIKRNCYIDVTLRQQMGTAARLFSCDRAWTDVFEQLYCTYAMRLDAPPVNAANHNRVKPDHLVAQMLDVACSHAGQFLSSFKCSSAIRTA